AVVVALSILIGDFVRQARRDEDFVVIRRGLLTFAVFALWDNLAGLYLSYFSTWRIEPLGFAVFLSSLGYVAARRTRQRVQQLSEIQKDLDVARRIQFSMWPTHFPPLPLFQVPVRSASITSVAGNFYGYVVVQDSRAGLLIADPPGHGVPAALS